MMMIDRESKKFNLNQLLIKAEEEEKKNNETIIVKIVANEKM